MWIRGFLTVRSLLASNNILTIKFNVLISQMFHLDSYLRFLAVDSFILIAGETPFFRPTQYFTMNAKFRSRDKVTREKRSESLCLSSLKEDQNNKKFKEISLEATKKDRIISKNIQKLKDSLGLKGEEQNFTNSIAIFNLYPIGD